ncbi:c-type cytochrome [Variovorax sp. PCZ-1]|uniref:c-type cytochrome n=1 Tax=Variovorax sp. PCZ-1 TaxID=2835533 RepID=UPI001BCC8A87|nr:c-type cytochrome [Variovorax sp. PCZ-1]MBS7806596.1 c-type cytochrome [Variovorax sp. PCZ-1]
MLNFIYVFIYQYFKRNMLRLVGFLLLIQVSPITMAESNLRQFSSEISLFESKQVLQARALNYSDEENGAALRKILDPARIDVVMSEYFQATLEQREVPQVHKLLEPIHKRLERAFTADHKAYEAEHLDSLTWSIEFMLRSQAASKRASSIPVKTTSTLPHATTESPISQQQVDELLKSLSGLVNSINNLLATSIRDKVSQGKFTGERAHRALELANRINTSAPTAIPRLRTLKDGQTVYQAQCVACHGGGIAISPRLGDVNAWQPRIQKGLPSMVESTLRGKGAMGAQGGGDWDDVEIARAVVFMANASGGRFEEPKPPASHPGYVLVVPRSAPQNNAVQIPFSQMDSTQRLKYGERLYSANCAACHLLSGKEVGPIKAILGSPKLQSPPVLIDILLNGQNGGRMPGWKQLRDEEISSIANFVRSKFANIDRNDIEPKDVSRLRK